jgi:hypothetical protein
VKLHHVNGEVMPEHKVIAAGLEPLGNRLMLWHLADILSHIESCRFCLTVPTDPFLKTLDTLNPDFRANGVGVFSFLVNWWTWHGPPSRRYSPQTTPSQHG